MDEGPCYVLGVEPAFCVAITLMYLEFLKDREMKCLRCFVIPVRGWALRTLGECSARLRVFDERVLSNWRDNGYGTCAFLVDYAFLTGRPWPTAR